MERIELYDRYINHQLSKDECKEFDARLESDKDFASDFKVYLFTVNGICREVHQDNIDFGVALKNLSKEQLCNIVGAKAESPVKPKILHFKPWMWQVASVAAIFVIIVLVFEIQPYIQLHNEGIRAVYREKNVEVDKIVKFNLAVIT